MSDTPDFLRLRGRSILVTGASSGIGRATAIAAAEQGARVVAVARRQGELDRVVSGLAGTGHAALSLDITDAAAVPDVLREAVSLVGPLDGLVHAAGGHATTPLRTITDERVNRLFELNVTTALVLAKSFRSAKVRGADPSLVLMSSAVGVVGQAGVSAYAATKAAVIAVAKSLGLELAREGIRVNAIAAGVVDTAMTQDLRRTVGEAAWSAIEAAHPLGFGSPEDVASAILYLLSPASRWVTGTALVIDGGYTAG